MKSAGLMATFAATLFGLLAAGCAKKEPPPPAGGPKGPAGVGGGPGGRSKLGQMMARTGKGGGSLSASIDNDEYARTAADVAKETPRKGSKESWDKMAGDFAAAARDLDQAVRAKDLAKAKAAQETLTASCLACHRDHRGGPGRAGPPR
jgi:hypothetical protein